MKNLFFKLICFIADHTNSLPILLFLISIRWDERYAHIRKEIKPKNFPKQPEDKNNSGKEYKIFSFGKNVLSADIVVSEEDIIISEMHGDGFRPATIRDQLRWIIKEWGGGVVRIAALNSFFSNKKLCYIPIFDADVYSFELVPKHFPTYRGEYIKFLAVKR